MYRRSGLPLFMACLLAIAAFSGIAQAQKKTLRLWTHSNVAFIEAQDQLIEKFERENPDIEIVRESFPEFQTKVVSSFAAGTEPDLMEWYGGTTKFAIGGAILPVPSSLMTEAQIQDTFWEAALENRVYKGQYYGLPAEVNVESPGLLVNTALIEQAGLTIPQSWHENGGPSSWAELINFAKEATMIRSGRLMRAGLGVVGGEEISMFLSLIWQLGGEYRDPENLRVDLTSEEAYEAIRFIQDTLNEDNVHSTDFPGRMDAFMQQTAVMTIGAPWYAAVIDQEIPGLQYEYFNLPAFIPGSDPFFLAEGGWGMIVSSRTEYPESAWRYVEFTLRPENLQHWAAIVGSVPSRQDLISHEYYRTGAGADVVGKVLQMVEYGRDPGAYTRDPYQFVWDIGYRNLQSILFGEVSVDEGLQMMENETNEMIDRLYENDM